MGQLIEAANGFRWGQLAGVGLLSAGLWSAGPAAAPGLPGLSHYAPRQVKVRPFITDDARVVGERLAQLETWALVDHAALQQWAIVAYGPTKCLELSLGGVFGADREPDGNRFAYALPLLAAKVLLRGYQAGAGPGFRLAAGTFLPHSQDTFKAVGYGTFGYVTVPQCFGEGERRRRQLPASGQRRSGHRPALARCHLGRWRTAAHGGRAVRGGRAVLGRPLRAGHGHGVSDELSVFR